MPRDPQPFPLTLDGNLLKCRNESRIRDLLALFSKDEIKELIEDGLALKVDLETYTAAMQFMGFVLNESTGAFHQLRCRNNADGQPELYLSDETYTL